MQNNSSSPRTTVFVQKPPVTRQRNHRYVSSCLMVFGSKIIGFGNEDYSARGLKKYYSVAMIVTRNLFSLILIGMTLLDDFLTSTPVESFFKWLQTAGLPIFIVCFVSWLLYHSVDHFVGRTVKRIIRHTRFNHMTELDLKKRQKTVASLVGTVLRAMIVVLTMMLVTKQLFPHINYAPIFASAGIIGVAIGFGAQSLIKDFLTGLFIITENQYRVGDIVDLGDGANGTIEHVGIRSTVLRDNDGNVHYLPNGTITHVINKTMDFSKVNFTLSVHPDTDIDLLAKVINNTGSTLAEEPKWKSKIIEPPHFLNVGSFSQLGMDVIVVGVTEPSEQWSVSGELRRRLIKDLTKAKIELAAPPASWPMPTKKK